MPAGRPTSLTPDLIQVAVEVASECPSYRAIARAIGVTPTTVREWLDKGDQPDSPELFRTFSKAIHGAISDGERALTRKIAAGEARDAAWLLTHSPFFRGEWSDAAAERKTERRTVGTVLEAVAAAELPADLERNLLLQMQARGLGSKAVEGES